MDEQSEHGIGYEDPARGIASGRLSTIVATDTPVRNENLANLVGWLHGLYVLVSTLFPLASLYLVPLDKAYIVFILWWAYCIPIFICQFYWKRCPLTLLEDVLRDGKDYDGGKWAELRKTLTFKQTARWAIIQPLLVWATTMVVGLVVACWLLLR